LGRRGPERPAPEGEALVAEAANDVLVHVAGALHLRELVGDAELREQVVEGDERGAQPGILVARQEADRASAPQRGGVLPRQRPGAVRVVVGLVVEEGVERALLGLVLEVLQDRRSDGRDGAA
jgi:hypothetical protein